MKVWGIEGIDALGSQDVAEIRRTLEVPEGAPLAACVARLVNVGNHRALIVAWRRIADIWPGATLLLVGDGPGREEVEAVIAHHDLAREVRLLGDRSDVAQLLVASDFHVLVSHADGVSLTLMEAMAAGKASVAVAAGSNPEVIAEGRTGMLVPPGDVHALAAAIAALVQDPFTADKMGREARRVFEALIGSGTVADETPMMDLEVPA